jgi:hypothetical protein
MISNTMPGTSRLLLAASGWAALAATLLPAASAERIVPTVAFLALAPGAAAVGAVRRLARARVRDDRLENLVVTVAVSLSLATLVSEGLLFAHGFTLSRAMIVLAGLTSAAALVPGRRAPREGREP